MKIDLHIHTSTGSDGNLPIEQVFQEAKKRDIDLMSITDHDYIDNQPQAITLAQKHGISYIPGVELNITFQYTDSKPISLDFLGYQFDINNQALKNKLKLIRTHRVNRAQQILDKLNFEFDKENLPRFTETDLKNIQNSVDGAFGRPHIANYLIAKGIVSDKQEAFDKYLAKCNVPKYPLSLAEASNLIRSANGILVHAHPSDPHGTSLATISPDLAEQARIIQKFMVNYIDGIECWHTGHDADTTAFLIKFAQKHNLLMTGGSDCHQKPVIMGTVPIPNWVATQFGKEKKG
ncbi:MAG: PHP domain-containing protein [Dehalococcoidales bacterium]|nr:PHP domain-containing protein [Dehalococcoidales bacterium]